MRICENNAPALLKPKRVEKLTEDDMPLLKLLEGSLDEACRHLLKCIGNDSEPILHKLWNSPVRTIPRKKAYCEALKQANRVISNLRLPSDSAAGASYGSSGFRNPAEVATSGEFYLTQHRLPVKKVCDC